MIKKNVTSCDIVIVSPCVLSRSTGSARAVHGNVHLDPRSQIQPTKTETYTQTMSNIVKI